MKKNIQYVLVVAVIFVAIGALYYQGNVAASKEFALSGQAIINYEDGSEPTVYHFDASTPELALIDANTGKSVSNIQLEIYGTPTFQGAAAASSWSIEGKSSLALASTTGIVKTIANQMPLQTPAWATQGVNSGQRIVLTSSTVTAAFIESLYDSWQNGASYQYVMTLNSLTFHAVANGQEASFTMPTSNTWYGTTVVCNLIWNFKFSQSAETFAITSLQVSWQSVPT